jgi:NDP-sugar pyrophosphorylase family protein
MYDRKNITAVILAGGKGTRLRPYTISLPKPLMPVGDHPIMEVIIRQLKNSGITRVIIAVGYLESLIKAYFGDGSKFGVEIIYSREDEPLGTAGPLQLVREKLTGSFILINGDTLTDLDLNEMLRSHREKGSLATVGITKRKVDIDFGVINLDAENRLVQWQEKPTIDYFVSMGIYVFEPKVLDYIPEGFYNLPDLIVALKEAGEKVGVFVHKGYWLDIGRFEDYQAACSLVEEKGKSFA